MSYHNLPIGNDFPKTVNAVIEIPKGSRNKYEYDESLDLIRLDRVLHSSVFYPADYGFIPQTRSEDGDHMDIMTLVTEPVYPGCVVSVRPIGIADMTDDKGKDWKILGVANDDPRYEKVHELSDVDPHLLKEVRNFLKSTNN